ncbi:trypsin-like peptidase domain-containing protein [Streptomyces sp. NPDC085946]|uniref:trypsin-like peptidase domain-containing protein n=1 Tax=Streptomyces sp. NPDC085946 TaxID=3365744 RepID=UPI0037D2890E
MASRNRSREAHDDAGEPRTGLDDALVRVHDPAGRPRGTGFAADHHGTVLTSHEAVDGLARLVVRAGERACAVTAEAVTPLPALGLALIRTDGLGADPLPVTVREGIAPGTYVRIAAGCWREARILGTTRATYTAADRCHPLDGVLELAIGTAGRDALRRGGGAAGGPVLDAATGAVVGVLGTALHAGRRDAGFAVPLPRVAPGGTPLAGLLAENAATVPAYGADLNLAGLLELAAASAGQDGPPLPRTAAPVERAAAAGPLTAFTRGPAAVLGLVGPPGSGRTTELAALAGRRARGGHPTVWLRGADLRGDDASVADAARRALERAARRVGASRAPLPADLGDITPERLADTARGLGRPLLLLLDGPEEMPPVPAHRLAAWAGGTARWLRARGARLVVACRPEYWESAGACFPADTLHAGDPAEDPEGLAPCVRLGDLTPAEAREARSRYGIADRVLADADARHPLTLRLLADVGAALPAAPEGPLDRHDVLSAHLDLRCLRVAVRLAAADGLRGTAVRRLATKVSGQVHEAARRSLGPGHGELDRESFEALFPRGPAPARLGGGTGWASAVLAEGLLVPAAGGYRFDHEELADWLQGTHLDLDAALRALVHDRPGDPGAVPHHRIGPVVEALLLLARRRGPGHLASRLADLVHALDDDPHSWWAARLLARTLARVPDATPYLAVLGLLADRVVAWRRQRRSVPAAFGPAFWTALPVAQEARFALLRRLVLADGPPCEPGPRFLDAVARLLAAEPAAVQRHLARWFDDERALPATPHATVATAAQALLHTHRHRALDELTEVLADSGHRRAGELLAVLAEEEPAALCRAVDRWARDARPARRAAALAHGLRVAPHLRTDADRALLRRTALALLARPADHALHGGALALLLRDPDTRARYLPQALEHFAAGDPHLPPRTLAGALADRPEPVLRAFGARLARPDTGEALRALADATPPALARRVAGLLGEAAARRPEAAGHLAEYVDRRLDEGPAARAALLPLLTALLDGGPQRVRAALAGVVAGSGGPGSRPLRRDLRDGLLARERDPAVLDALLRAAVPAAGGDDLRALVHRTGTLLVRTPEGATLFDRALVDLGRHVPGFAARVTGWLAAAPREWAALVGPSARRTLEKLPGVRVPV